MSDIYHVECGCCFAQAWGFYRTELDAEGWIVKHAKGEPFHLCNVCVRRFTESRQLDDLFALPAAARRKAKRPDLPDLQPIGSWSRYHAKCVTCGTTSSRHTGYGLCKRCYDNQRNARLKLEPAR